MKREILKKEISDKIDNYYKKLIDLIKDDRTTWEVDPLVSLASSGELMSFEHDGFWQAMDTLRDKTHLEELWESGNAPWKNW